MNIAIRAIYEKGQLRPLDPLDLAEQTVVRISLETNSEDSERKAWHEQGQRSLMSVWDNEADDVHNVLLTR